MTKRLFLLIATFVGVCNAIWMLILHIQIDKLGDVCTVNKIISCDVLKNKQYSEWWGVPVPVFALFSFLILFILAWRGWRKTGSDRIREDAYALLLWIFSLLASLGLAYISFVVLKKLCPFCFIFYVLVISGWLTAKAIVRSQGKKPLTAIKNHCFEFYRNQWVWVAGVAFACITVFSHFVFESQGALSVTAITIKGDEMKTTGNPNAKVTLTIFSDFQCPSCKNTAGILKELETSGYATKIKIIYKFFPLDPSCNAGAAYGQHLMACDAAKAAVCAGQQQRFWRFHDLLFQNQESLYQKKFYQIAEEENLDMNKYAACYHSKEALEEVKKDADEGVKIPITATPTIFFNGKKYDGQITSDNIKKMIDSLL